MISRVLENQIRDRLFQGYVLILFGPRQVGKTTIVQRILSEHDGRYESCEAIATKRDLQKTLESAQAVKDYIGSTKLLILDEAQEVENIGQILKFMHDTLPDVQIIATGSSSFELANQVGEPLVGRAKWFSLYPFSIAEIGQDLSPSQVDGKIDDILRYGLMPDVYTAENSEQAEETIRDIVKGYLFKDILDYDLIRKSQKVQQLLEALALQVGSEVSLNELSQMLGIHVVTIEKYLDILEKVFIIKILRPLSKGNPRKEIRSKMKIYFLDLGIRNQLISDHRPVELRQDKGVLWENFCVMELVKLREYSNVSSNLYFWRTYDQAEVDLVEFKDGKYTAYEFKYSPKRSASVPKNFAESYPEHEFHVINRENYRGFFGELRSK